MREVHPAFDSTTSTWFVGNKEAPTIRALLAKLGGDVVAIGYQPIGTATPLVVREPHDRSELGRALCVSLRIEIFDSATGAIRSSIDDADGHIELARPSQSVKPQRAPLSVRRTYTSGENTILDLWAGGMTGPAIAAQFFIKTSRVSNVIEKARKRNDRRAVVRIPASIGVTR